VALAPEKHHFGPDNASLQVRTYREGVAAKAGHDLILAVTRWDATLEVAGEPAQRTVTLNADPRSLEVREGLGGVKPLTDRDRDEIRRNIDEKVLRGAPISFRSTAVRRAEDRLEVDGDLTIGASTRPISARLDVDAQRTATGTVALTQSAWGIKPYRGLMGALKVRDELEIAIEAPLAGG
jgi:polyisoprenoid-binding protein YceI